ncbi:ATP-binding cassette domain-containing protein [Steroidobacter agaridevorans]|uniref:ATP-binding cassette domain-containing protein n=1 Tax=Steroidobacter agaridevorans TaxID=2695856 RepID=UPI00132A59A2|nr:ATP-binding cassette domain-containing protein [Steroidobacter agaridevorans]GFE90600.1 ABC transporter ATP-binding protein [Steroidobacter agaridevorans]
MSPVIVARDVAYEFSNGRELFKHLSFSLNATRSALVGPNGVGKTCLARLLAGELEPTSGAIQRDGPVSLFAQREPPEPIAVADYLASVDQWSLTRDRLLTNIDQQALCTSLSGGQWMRVRLARALDDGFLILDEPTNDLDREGREAVFQFLRSHAGGVLLISHDREALESCDEILELSNLGLMKFGGSWSEYVVEKDRERARLGAALDQAKRERDAAVIHRIEQQARQEKRNRRGQAAAARGGIPRILAGGRKRAAQVTTGKRDVALVERADAAVTKAHEAFADLKIDPVMYADLMGQELHSQKLIAEARGFNIRFRDWLYPRDLDFSWRGNVRLALQGPNGSGKSTLLKALTGAPSITRGELNRGQLVTLYIDQRCSALDDTLSVLDNVRSVAPGNESEIRTHLARFLFPRDTVFQKAHSLSGGERLRATLARALLATTKPELLLLDEPTNNLDLANIEFLEALVREFRGALIVVSHDQRFLENCGVTAAFELPGDG